MTNEEDKAMHDASVYKVDPSRIGLHSTGIYIRAILDDRWGSHDVVHLDADSLISWLHSRGDCNPMAENMLGVVLGHDQICERIQQ